MGKTLYLAGPITGLPKEQYLTAFKYWENNLKSTYPDAVVINPAELLEPISDLDQAQLMNICISMVAVSDAAYFMPGWENSAGAKQEHEYARQMGITRKMLKIKTDTYEQGEE